MFCRHQWLALCFRDEPEDEKEESMLNLQNDRQGQSINHRTQRRVHASYSGFSCLSVDSLKNVKRKLLMPQVGIDCPLEWHSRWRDSKWTCIWEVSQHKSVSAKAARCVFKTLRFKSWVQKGFGGCFIIKQCSLWSSHIETLLTVYKWLLQKNHKSSKWYINIYIETQSLSGRLLSTKKYKTYQVDEG